MSSYVPKRPWTISQFLCHKASQIEEQFVEDGYRFGMMSYIPDLDWVPDEMSAITSSYTRICALT
jgi:hypothetical protein